MDDTAEHIKALPGFKDGGNMTVAEVAEALGMSEKKAEPLLYQAVLRGELYRWPGIAGQPPRYHRTGPAKTMIRERFSA